MWHLGCWPTPTRGKWLTNRFTFDELQCKPETQMCANQTRPLPPLICFYRHCCRSKHNADPNQTKLAFFWCLDCSDSADCGADRLNKWQSDTNTCSTITMGQQIFFSFFLTELPPCGYSQKFTEVVFIIIIFLYLFKVIFWDISAVCNCIEYKDVSYRNHF